MKKNSEKNIEQQRLHFNSISERYKKGREQENHKRIKDIIWSRGTKPISDRLPQNFKMLEAMCGYAEGYNIVSETLGIPGDYLGFDYSDDIVLSLRKTNPELNVIHADATTFVPDSKDYDLIFLAGGLHHVPDHAEKVVAQLSSALKPGGVFLNFEPTHANPLYKMVRDRIYKKNDIFDSETERAFSVDELKSFFAKAGLNPVTIQNAGLSAYTLYYNPYAFPLLNKGGVKGVDLFSAIDGLFLENKLGQFFSFATLSVWEKPL